MVNPLTKCDGSEWNLSFAFEKKKTMCGWVDRWMGGIKSDLQILQTQLNYKFGAALWAGWCVAECVARSLRVAAALNTFKVQKSSNCHEWSKEIMINKSL